MAQSGDIIITEIMINPAAVADVDGEYFEIFNTTNAPIDLAGWVLSDQGTETHTIGGPLVIEPGGVLVFGRNGNPATNGGLVVDYVYTAISLANSADSIILKDVAGNEIDAVVYNNASGWLIPNGKSLELSNGAFNATTNDLVANWLVASQIYGAGDFGTPGILNDTVSIPTSENNYIVGTGGADVIDLLDGDDYFWGVSGSDHINGGMGSDRLFGSSGDDVLKGGGGIDMLDGGADVDTADFSDKTQSVVVTINGATVVTATVGGVAEDTLVNIENVIGGSGADTLIGDAVANTLDGGNGNDFLNGAGGGDVLLGGGDNDTLLGGVGSDSLDGGTNTAVVGQAQASVGDTASYVNSDALVIVNLLLDTATGGHATGDTLDGIENLIGSAFGDTLTGDDTANYIDGFNDNDSLFGNGGDDYLNGGNGDDTLSGGLGADFLNGGSGLGDVADYSLSNVGVTAGVNAGAVNSGGHAQGDTLWVEDITGSSHNDSLVGNSVQNTLTGGGGDDFLNAGDNSDELYGGNGDDTLIGGRGADLIDGGTNTAVGDTASYVNAGARIVGSLLTNTVTFSGNGTGDTLVGIENITGSAFDDFIYGDNNANTLDGFGGNDFIVGNGGVDKLRGGAGIDTLDGGTGNDTLTGGSGNDIYDFNTFSFGQDTITDWQNGSDKLDFSNLNLDITDFTITQSGANTLLTYTFNPTQTVTLLSINMALIDAGDFVV